MKRLIDRGLMFGNMVEVSTPTMVTRYRTALEKLTGLKTSLNEFHIDLSGFSPEIADELGDTLYLNPNGCNRQFILLGLEQRGAPLLNTHFSTTRSIMRQFIDDNRQVLATLTARDAVIGELQNSVWSLSQPRDLVDLRTIRVEANTTTGRVTEAETLSAMIETFQTDPDDWHDDAKIDRMIGLANAVGDIRQNPVSLVKTVYRKGNFFTTHFGGLYVFRDARRPGILYRDPTFGRMKIDGVSMIDLDDQEDVAEFLRKNGLIESILHARAFDASGLLRQRLDFMMVDVLADLPDAPADLADLTRRDLRRLSLRQKEELPAAFRIVSNALRYLEQGGQRPKLDDEDDGYFYLIRGAPGLDRDLVNQLLAELTPLDLRQLFICHKQAFYAAYQGWPERKKDYVAAFLEREYAMDKAGTRARLFGDEPDMRDPAVPMGPWGPAKRREED